MMTRRAAGILGQRDQMARRTADEQFRPTGSAGGRFVSDLWSSSGEAHGLGRLDEEGLDAGPHALEGGDAGRIEMRA